MKFSLRFACLIGIVGLSAAGCGSDDAGETDAPTIISNVEAIDAINGARQNVDVVIVGDSIQAVGPDAGAAYAEHAGALRIAGDGKFLIPGLWDAHVHVAFAPGVDHTVFFPLSIAYGITSLRDTGGHLDKLAPAIDAAQTDPLTPDLYFSGPLIDGRQRVYDGSSPSRPDLSIGVSSAEDAAAAVDDLASRGVHFLKAYEMLSPEAFSAALARADHHGLPVSIHPPLSMTASDAAIAGADDMQHLRNLEFDCAGNSDELHRERIDLLNEKADAPGADVRGEIHRAQRTRAVAAMEDAACAELIDILKENGVSQTPTLTVTRFATNALFLQPRWRKTYELLPPEIAENWLTRSIALDKLETSAETRAYDAWLMAMVARLNAEGVTIMAGTDAPIGFLTPGVSLHEELALLVDAGLSPLEALGAATVAPAAFFGLEGRMGAIAPGMRANLVLLDNDPLADIRNTTSIGAVLKDGVYLNRGTLDALRNEPSMADSERLGGLAE